MKWDWIINVSCLIVQCAAKFQTSGLSDKWVCVVGQVGCRTNGTALSYKGVVGQLGFVTSDM